MTPVERETLERTLEQLTTGEKLELIEYLAHSLRSEVQPPSAARQRTALSRLRKKLAVLTVQNPEDGVSNRDHDQLLYGERR